MMKEIRKAVFVRPASPCEDRVWRFEKTFSLTKPVRRATLAASALGVYTASLNGSEVPVYVLAPGWTAYRKRLQVQEYDVTAMLQKENTLSLCAGIGFRFVSNSGFRKYRPEKFPDDVIPMGELAVIAALTVEYEDGTVETILTDESWLVSQTEWRYAQMYNGDDYDATFVPDAPTHAVAVPLSTDCLIPQEGAPIMEQERLPVKEVIRTPAGETVLDFGQNLTGYVSFRVKGTRGEECVLSHGEVLDRDGNFFRENYRSARAQIHFICDEEEHFFKPRYTFYGFRYVRVDAWSGELDPADFTAIVVHSDMERTGYFESSNEKLNQLFHNIIWGQKGNFVDVPTDCPQRDERYGWTGDAQVFCRCASLNFDTRRFFGKWLGDMRADQRTSGLVGRIIPSVCDADLGSAAWSDVCTVLPYQMYLTYGDPAFLKDNLDMMRRWVDYMRGRFDDFVGPEEHHYGDWVALDVPEGRYIGATPKGFIASAYAYYSTRIYQKSCAVLGVDCPAEYEAFAERAKREIYEKYMDEEAFAAAHLDDDAKLRTQTRCAILLFFGLCRSDEERRAIAEELNTLVRENGTRLTTGFVGTPYLLHALSENGYVETAFDLLLQEAFPSWLFSVNRGATTMWEHWDGIREDGTMWSTDMNSFNHYAYGAVGDWIYARVLGIGYDEKEPGFAHTILAPLTTKRLDFVRGSLKTSFGTISSAWHHEGDKTVYEFTVPDGVRATVRLPGIEKEVGAGEYRFVC